MKPTTFLLFFLTMACRNETKAVIEPSDSVVITDMDGDGYNADEDCDDSSELINPGATEICDGQDNNCDDQIDEGVLSVFFTDSDGDGFGNPNSSIEACESPAGTVPNSNDCDDSNPDAYPSNNEICDEVDNNCNGEIDEGVGDVWYPDGDDDGFGNEQEPTFLCSEQPGYTDIAGDCDDNNATVNPDAAEVCDSLDNNCNANIDEGVTNTYYLDADGDGYGDSNSSIEACDRPSNAVENADDCDDLAFEVNPSAQEICDAIDNDCDGSTDEPGADGSQLFFADNDGDNYGDISNSLLRCDQPAGYVSDNTDCDDNNSGQNPGEAEICDSIDNNCDGSIDDADPTVVGQSIWALDHDADGYGDPNLTVSSCTQPAGYIADSTDCDDTNATAYPGGTEVCDGSDNSCNGLVDDADPAVSYSNSEIWYSDTDGDGFGDANSSTQSCSQPISTSSNNLDCDDSDALISPIGLEVCDSQDNNCDGVVDNAAYDAVTWYVDQDSDGFGSLALTELSCQPSAGFVGNADDCDDNDDDTNPDGTEVCGNGKDDNCDGLTDDTSSINGNTFYLDSDGDSFGDSSTTLLACTAPNDYVTDATDCNDSNPLIYPNATENCSGPDLDCDGVAPAHCSSCLEIVEAGSSVGTGTYTIESPTQGMTDVYCEMDTDGGGWTLVQRTVWDWSDSAQLMTNYNDWYSNTYGSISPGSAYRMAGEGWSDFNIELDHMMIHHARDQNSSMNCDPLYYLANSGDYNITNSSATITGWISDITMFNDIALDTYGNNVCTDYYTAVPWFYSTCCSTCPTFFQGYWSDEPHPMVNYLTVPDHNGQVASDVCQSGDATQSFSPSYQGINEMEYFLR